MTHFSRLLPSGNTSKFSLYSLVAAWYSVFLAISHHSRKYKRTMLAETGVLSQCLVPPCSLTILFLVVFVLDSGCETSYLTEKCPHVCSGGKFQSPH